jgi:hypothetical protein
MDDDSPTSAGVAGKSLRSLLWAGMGLIVVHVVAVAKLLVLSELSGAIAVTEWARVLLLVGSTVAGLGLMWLAHRRGRLTRGRLLALGVLVAAVVVVLVWF